MDSNCNTYRGCVRVERQRERLAGQKARRGAKELADFPGDEKLTRATTIRSLRTAWPGGQPFGFSENFPLFPWIARPVRRTIARHVFLELQAWLHLFHSKPRGTELWQTRSVADKRVERDSGLANAKHHSTVR
jgi:hypothetical protein